MICNDCTTLQNVAALNGVEFSNNCASIGGNVQTFDKNGCAVKLDFKGLDLNVPFGSDLVDAINSFTELTDLNASGAYFTGDLPSIHSASLRNLDLSYNSFTGPVDSVSFPASLTSIDVSNNCLTGTTPKSFSSSVWSFNNFDDQSVQNSACEVQLDEDAAAGNAANGASQDCLTLVAALNQITIPAKKNPFAQFNASYCIGTLGNSTYYTWQTTPLPWTPSTTTTVATATPQVTSSTAGGQQFLYDFGLELERLNAWQHKAKHLAKHQAKHRVLKGRDEPRALARRSFQTQYNLVGLSFKGLGISGALPPALGGLGSLVSLDLSGNTFSGPVPASWTGLTALKVLNIQGNQLTGSVLDSLLKVVAANGGVPPLVGLISSDCLILVSALQNMTVPAKYLGVPNPFALFNQSLCATDFRNSSFGGRITWATNPIPTTTTSTTTTTATTTTTTATTTSTTTMATTTTTTKINGAPFYYWRKRDEHVMERRSATTNYKIAGLSLKNMGITGSISAALGNLVNLQSLDVSGNKFTGQIPASFLQLTALKFFDYAGNSFDPNGATLLALINQIRANGGSASNVLSNDCLLLTGTFARVAKALTAFNQDCSNVNNNTYVGWTYGPPVTTTTTTTTTLTTSTSTSTTTTTTLTTSTSTSTTTATVTTTTTTNTATTTTTTKINGAPFFFKRDANIRDANIERRDPNANRYILTTLSVSNLTLGGQVPSGICQLTNIQSLDLSANKFTGYLPNCLGNLKSLKYLNVDGNNFLGAVPPQVLDIINGNGGSVNYGSTCMYGNPLNWKASGCAQPATVATNCFDLSRDKTFIDPMYDGAWLSWSKYQGEQWIKNNAPASNNPILPEYLYQQFLVYVSKVKRCQKKHPEFTYWTYKSVHPPSPSPYKWKGKKAKNLAKPKVTPLVGQRK